MNPVLRNSFNAALAACTTCLMALFGGTSFASNTCHNVHGEIESWQGFPPNIIIHTEHALIGVPEEEGMLPNNFERGLSLARNKARGQFEVCPLGYEVTRGETSFQMVCVQSILVSHTLHQGTGPLDNAWVPATSAGRFINVTGCKAHR